MVEAFEATSDNEDESRMIKDDALIKTSESSSPTLLYISCGWDLSRSSTHVVGGWFLKCNACNQCNQRLLLNWQHHCLSSPPLAFSATLHRSLTQPHLPAVFSFSPAYLPCNAHTFSLSHFIIPRNATAARDSPSLWSFISQMTPSYKTPQKSAVETEVEPLQ